MKTIQCAFLLLIFGFTLSGTVNAETFTDSEHHFQISYGPAWEINIDLSPTIKFSLISKQHIAGSSLAGSHRPMANAHVSVKSLDPSISLQIYIKNDIGVASAIWTIIEEKQLPSLREEHKLLVLKRNMGPFSQKVYKLLVKAHGNIYDLSCAFPINQATLFDQRCTSLINSFSVLP